MRTIIQAKNYLQEDPGGNSAVDHTKYSHVVALRHLGDDFCHTLVQRLEKKAEKGKIGWDDPEMLTMLERELVIRSNKISFRWAYKSKDLIDIAAFAAMIWNLQPIKDK